MKKILLICLFILTNSAVSLAQNQVEWDGKYQLQLSDFLSKATKIGEGNIYSINMGSLIEFNYQMSNAEFVFTKNFNSKVSCNMKRKAASLVAPDSLIAADLLAFGQYQFDLSELYARKFRKKLYEEKGAFSNANFFSPVYNQIQEEFSERITLDSKTTDLGRDRAKLKELHSAVLKGIEELADFCKSCKPKKKK